MRRKCAQQPAERSWIKRKDGNMYRVYEIDYHCRSWLVGTADTLKEARKIERKALKASSGEYPTFIEEF